MKARWVITLNGQDSEIQRLAYAVEEIGRKAEVVRIGHVYEEILDKPSQEKECVVVTGSVLVTSAMSRARPMWVPGSWHDVDTFKCSNYYALIGEHITQRDYAFLPLSEVDRNKMRLYQRFGVDGKMFIRPDFGEKIFTGEVVHEDVFETWQSMRDPYTAIPGTTLCVVSRPVKIEKELRLVMHKGRVVTGSTYRIMGMIEQVPLEEQENKHQIVEFAEMVAGKLSGFPAVYLMDIAKDEFGLSVMEVGSVNCAGYYACDLHKLAQAVSEEAEREYAERFGAV